jgi:hypothetical protein
VFTPAQGGEITACIVFQAAGRPSFDPMMILRVPLKENHEQSRPAVIQLLVVLGH